MPPPRLNRRVETVAAALAAAATAHSVWGNVKGTYNTVVGKREYKVTVDSADPIYADVMSEMLTLIPPTLQRDLLAGYNRSSRADAKSLALYHAGATEHTITLDGHKVTVKVTSAAPQKSDGSQPVDTADDIWNAFAPKRAVFTTRTERGRDALIAWLGSLTDRRKERNNPPSLNLLTRWGSWEPMAEITGRPLNSVVLPTGQLDRIVGDLATFLAGRADYDRLGIPWHRGYLFRGVPGCGKTTVPRALAAHFNLDLWYMPLSDIPGDTDILRQIAQIRSGILLLEDVDVFDAATSRTEGDKRVTMSGLLNALDGVATPPGLVTIMTSNHADQLDEALTRDGRVDLDEEFVPILDVDHATRLFAAMYPGANLLPATVAERLVGVTPAQIVGVCKRHMHDAPGAVHQFAAIDLTPAVPV